ncbi:MAG: RagB/SusD family nutrient uptake outer membrane protein [Tannerellaceae bacterium]|nr:RagB/SusD family nutrient uptake outer membrane protein [Tannerellaceae bacterium]MDD3358635.1 RagB/SusD family nutrient uptake outer membrane protein [Parabacteroides sp.]MDD4404525.1 RagB/SusD family nutrient uptake outer membrane protein [Parabacteroides sp.]
MKNIKYNLLAIFTFFVLMMPSCNYLDVSEYFEDTLHVDSVFQKKVYLEKFLWGAAALLPDEGNIFTNSYYPAVLGSDESFTMWESSYNSQRFPINEITADNLGSMNIWPNMYIIIRKANTILSRINECPDMNAQEKREIVGYTHFLRGYAYYFLVLNYGPCILVGDEIIDTSLDSDAYATERATYDECVEYACKELETAAEYIPATVPINLFGRPTKGAAYGLIARLRVYAASPLYNGGKAAKTYFSNFKRKSDQVHYISQTYDEKKWAVAAAACKRIMDMGTYKLHTVEASFDTPALPENVTSDPHYYSTFPDGASGIDPLRSYAEMFNGEAISFKNEEIIFGRYSNSVKNATQNAFPSAFGGWNGFCLPQHVIDAYRMADGKTINESSNEYPYNEDGFTEKASAFSGYELRANVSKMYANREMRFYASVGFSGCLWPMRSTTETGKYLQEVRYGLDQNSGKSAATEGDAKNYPITGYVIKKYIHGDDAWKGSNGSVLDKPFIMVRYADILLMYAECLNNLTQSHTITDAQGNSQTFVRDAKQIANAFNQVRYRAGLPGLTENEISSQDNFFEALKTERMVEFLHEGLRYYDVRRWGIVAEVESKPIMGMDTDKPERSGYYNRVICNYITVRNRVFLPKMVLLPIERQEIKRVPTLDQNPGWEN